MSIKPHCFGLTAPIRLIATNIVVDDMIKHDFELCFSFLAEMWPDVSCVRFVS